MARKQSTAELLAQTIEVQAARLAGVAEVLQHLEESSGVGDALNLCRDAVEAVNDSISDVATKVRELRHA